MAIGLDGAGAAAERAAVTFGNEHEWRMLPAGAGVERHAEIRGKAEALNTAFRYARLGVGCQVVMDGDARHDPSESPALIAPIRQGRAMDLEELRHPLAWLSMPIDNPVFRGWFRVVEAVGR